MYQQFQSRIKNLIGSSGLEQVQSYVQSNVEWLSQLSQESMLHVETTDAAPVFNPNLFTQLQDNFLTCFVFIEPVPVFDSVIWIDSLRMAAVALAATARSETMIRTFLEKDGYSLLSEIVFQFTGKKGNFSDRELKELAKEVLEERQWTRTDLMLNDPEASKYAVVWLLAVMASSPRLYVR